MMLRVVCYKAERDYIAQCLEYDLNAEGRTPEAALAAFEQMMDARMAVARELGVGLFDSVPPPPPELVHLLDPDLKMLN
jgi:hypothetical protein